jgi:hypothetical protein
MGSALFGFGMGLCRATPRAGSGTGAACDPNAAVSGCRGLCLPLDDTTAMCADGCTLGVGDSCGFGGDSQDPAEAACLFAFSNTSDLGDAAACAALCDCNDECPQPELVCVPLGADGTAYYGRMGYCDLPLDGAASDGMPCGTAGAGS